MYVCIHSIFVSIQQYFIYVKWNGSHVDIYNVHRELTLICLQYVKGLSVNQSSNVAFLFCSYSGCRRMSDDDDDKKIIKANTKSALLNKQYVKREF